MLDKKSVIVKTTKLNLGGFAGEIYLIETADGQRCIRKSYANNPTVDINEEWDALVFLYDKGYCVPKPISKDSNCIYMQYMENGHLGDVYEKSGKESQQMIIKKFTKLLLDLHILDTSGVEKPYSGRFIENELCEIKNIIEEKQLSKYLAALDRLELLSANVKEQPLCFIHRDYHPWNVLTDNNGRLYVIDLLLKQGDFRFDVAWTYMLMARSWFCEFAEEFLLEYGKLNPHTSDNFDFYKSLANLRWLVNVSPLSPLDEVKSGFLRNMIKKAEMLL